MNNRYQNLLWDVDATLLSFELAEAVAIRACFLQQGLGECSDEMLARYSRINRGYWEMLERGEIEKNVLLVRRFEDLFAEYDLPGDAVAFNLEYQVRLGDTIIFLDDGKTLLEQLKEDGYRLFVVTNGTSKAQSRKLEKSGIGALVDDVFISDQIGYEKPSHGFFQAIWDRLGEECKDHTMIIGDSLTSDMKGGLQEKITTVWYNPKKRENNTDIRPDYEIGNLWELLDILND